MNPAAPLPGSLQELEARQDDVLRQLDDLERRVSAVLVEFSGVAPSGEPYTPAALHIVAPLGWGQTAQRAQAHHSAAMVGPETRVP